MNEYETMIMERISKRKYIKFIGDHSVEVKINGLHVEGSPFLVKAYNADKVKVTDINSGVVGKPVFFSSKCNISLFPFIYFIH